MGARLRYLARQHLQQMAKAAAGTYPQVACLSFDSISHAIEIDGRYERDELDALAKHVFPHLSDTAVCLDIGANIGNHTLFFADQFDKVIAFEPHPRLFPLLSYNTDLLDNVTALNFGLSTEATTVSASALPGNIGSSQIGREADGNQVFQLEVKKLDDVAEVASIERIDFVKLDVEGHEPLVIAGAKEVLTRHKPVIALEILKEEVQDGASDALNALRDIGYDRFYELRSQRPFAHSARPLLKAAAAVELVLGRMPVNNYSLEPLDTLAVRNYPMLIAATEPLQPAS